MYCKFCGNEIDQGARYCDKCGSIVTENETPGMDDGYVPEVIDSYREAELDNSARKSLVFGILSIAFGSIIGLIFALIGGKHAKRYADLNAGVVEGRAKVGKILCTIGVPYGILSFFYAVLVLAGLASALA